MDKQYLLSVIATAIDLNKKFLMRIAYDVGLITKEHYQDYLKTILYIPEKNKENEEKIELKVNEDKPSIKLKQ